MKTGLIYAVIAIFLCALHTVTVRFFGVHWHVQPFVFVSLASLVAALTLLVASGKGNLGVKTLKQPHTWMFSFISVVMDILILFVLLHVSATEISLMIRLSIITSAIICRIALGRKINGKSYLGFAMVGLGFLIVTTNLEPDTKALSIFLTLIIVACQSLRTFITETHPTNNQASSWDDSCRVTGYVILVTSFIFLILGLSIAYFKTFLTIEEIQNIPMLGAFPNLADFISPKTVVSSTFTGVFVLAIANYFYFQGTKRVGSDTFLMVGALLPVFAFILEVIVAQFGLLSITSIHPLDLLAGVLIVGGALWSIYVKIYMDKKQRKLAPKAKAELQVIRDSIHSTMMCFNDDEELVAKKLGVGKRTLKGIMTTDNPVNKNTSHKIILNYTQNVSGLDHLTGTLNKSSFYTKLNSLNVNDKALVIFIDLNKFKPVNDKYGHQAGDSILEGIAKRLMTDFGQDNIVARLGGDEFCLIIYNADKNSEKFVTKKIKKIVSEPFVVEGIKDEISVGCSIGSAHYPTDGEHGLALKDIADERMYKDKEVNGDSR